MGKRNPRKLKEKLMKDLYYYGVIIPEDIAQGMIDKGWTKPPKDAFVPPQPVVVEILTQNNQVMPSILNRVDQVYQERYLT